MALNTQLADAAANAACNALAALVNGGSIKFYSGAQPANGNTAPTGTLLATLPLNTTAFGAAAAGVAPMATSPNPVQASASQSGTAGYACFCDSGGAVKWMVSVGTSGCNLNMGTTSITSGATVQVTSYTFSIAEAGS
jgi:hypothetical protein